MPLLSRLGSQTSSHCIGAFAPENTLHRACSDYRWRGGWIELPTVLENQVNVLHGFVFPTSQFLGKRPEIHGMLDLVIVP